MGEIDFDELDKAVNSLMANGTKPQPQGDSATPKPTEASAPVAPASPVPDTPATTSSSVPATPPSTATPSATPVQPTTTPATPATPPTKPVTTAPAVKRRGQFMDVMHPSSDMRSSDAAPKRPVSREATTIAPPAPAPKPAVQGISSAPTTEKPVVSSPEPAPETPKTTVPAQMPDPIDMAESQVSATVPATPVSQPTPPSLDDNELSKQLSELTKLESDKTEQAAKETPEPVEPAVGVKQNQPAESPFLPDAKVEKRPLGTPAPQLTSANESTETPAPVADAPKPAADIPKPATETPKSNVDAPKPEEADKPEAPVAQNLQVPPKTPMPAELNKDLLEIESDSTGKVANAKPTTAKDAPTPASDKKDVKPVATSGGSIPMQYKEKQNDTPNPGEGAKSIYDPSNYHEPVKKPVKKKSGWGAAIFVILLTILGAIGGVVAYFILTGTIKLPF